MRLRHQLLLVSLLVLCLPWAGCQFVRETETAMLEAQESALLATARVLSLRLGQEEALWQPGATSPVANNPIYVHALDTAPVLDGFDDDWRHFELQSSPMRVAGASDQDPQELEAELLAGIFRNQIYLFLQIPDSTLDGLVPGEDPLRSGDFLRILRANQPDLYLGASAPGNVHARYQLDGEIRSEYGLSGVWNHTGDGYLIELRIRPRLIDQTLGLEFVSKNSTATDATHRGIGIAQSHALPVLMPNSRLAEDVSQFTEAGFRLSVLDSEGWLVATAGSLEPISDQTLSNGWATRFYRFVLRDSDALQLRPWRQSGRLDGEDVSSALAGTASSSRFSYGVRKAGRTAVPISRDGLIIGAVVAEQTSDSLTTSTNTAFSRLIFWTLVSVLFVGVGLFAYASLLSFRVRRLSKAAESALDEHGNLNRSFPQSSASDELGDLNRSYQRLLHQLQEYTDYLKSLSSKLSHELKTPLAVVRSSLDNLEQQQLSPEAKVYAERASEGATRLSAIFAALSSASRLEQSIQYAEFEEVDLLALVRSLAEAYKDAYPSNPICLTLPSEIDSLVLSLAPELIVQLLDKLVDNAVGFSDQESPINLSVLVDNDLVEVCVSNRGPLLPQEMRAQLFESLVSVRSTATLQEPFGEMHLGLGLYIARLIAEFHQGSIRLENRKDGEGVDAVLRLPVQRETH